MLSYSIGKNMATPSYKGGWEMKPPLGSLGSLLTKRRKEYLLGSNKEAMWHHPEFCWEPWGMFHLYLPMT